MRRMLALLAAVGLVASLGPASVVAAPTTQPNSFHGDLDMVGWGDGPLVGHVVADILDQTTTRPGSGTVDIRWAQGGPVLRSRGVLTTVWFGQQPDNPDVGAVRWAGGNGTLCDTTTAGTSCGPFGVIFNEAVDPAFANFVGWSATGTDKCCDGLWYQVGKGGFALKYLGPAGKVSVAVTGASGPMQPGASRAVAATVRGAADTSVYWSVREPNGGTITQTGVYTAPALPGTYTVTATSRADVRASASVRVPVICGTPTAAPALGLNSKTTTGAKYEPPDGSAYFGFAYRLWEGEASWGDTRPFSARICDATTVELAGKTPTTLWVWGSWPDPTTGFAGSFSAAKADIDRIHAALGPTVVPYLQWSFIQQEFGTAPITTRDVASGAYDGYIRQYARDVKAYGQPLFVVPFCTEMNGNWWPSCSPKANPALTQADFVNAWRRVVDIFRQQGVTNVAWVWALNTPLPEGQDWGWDNDWQAYYPGDAYVDWVGSDLYEWGQPSWIDPVYAFAVAHAKPYILPEFGVRGAYSDMTHAEHVQWLTTMRDYVESHPKIKAMTYFNYKGNPDPTYANASTHVYLYDGQVNYVPDVNDDDLRLLAGGPDIRALYAAQISSPRYVSTLVTGP
jgi:hypothetical protein